MAAHVTIGGTDYPVIFDAPGETANILQLNEITEPTLLKMYAVLEGDAIPDRFITYTNLVKLLQKNSNIRVGQATLVVGTNTITYQVGGINTPMLNTNYALLIFGGSELGAYDRVKFTDKFTISVIDAGTIDYIVISNT